MDRIITDEIKKVLDQDRDICYEVVDEILIAYNRINKYQKINTNYYKLLLDEFVFNTNIKNTKYQKLYNIQKVKYQDIDYYYLTLNIITIINNNEDLESKLLEIKISKKKPSLLLHSCCGPCSSYVIEYLKEYFNITILYYNPNIDNKEEYLKRLDNLNKIVMCLDSNIKVIAIDYNHLEYLEYIKGYENSQEGGKRCYLCYEQRMDLLASNAALYDYFTTTLSISPYKNAKWLNEIGIRMQNKYHVKYLYSNFKMNDGYKKSIELSKKYNLYRQDYCGCEYSKK